MTWSFPEKDFYKISQGNKVPLKVAVLFPPRLDSYQAHFDQYPSGFPRLEGVHPIFIPGAMLGRNFRGIVETSFPHFFSQVSFLEGTESSLPEGAQLAIIVKDLKGTLTDFVRGNGYGTSEVQYTLVMKTPGGENLFVHRGEGLHGFNHPTHNLDGSLPENKRIDLFGGLGLNFTVSTLHSSSASRESSVSSKYVEIYTPSLQKAMGDSIVRFGEALWKEKVVFAYAEKMQAIQKAEVERRTRPSDLVLSLDFDDSKSILPNNAIDAGEASFLKGTLTNKGDGMAFGVSLQADTPFNGLQFPRELSLGDIPPGEFKSFEVPVQAGLDIGTGNAEFTLRAREKRGFDSNKVAIRVSAARLEKPDMVIADYRINDGKSGLAKGNGNGIPENGETLEIVPLIKNNGVGQAVNVSLSIESINQGIVVKKGAVILPQILPGQTISTPLAFEIPATFSDPSIQLKLAAVDARGAAKTDRMFVLKTDILRPVLSFEYKIIDGNGNGFVENGERGEIEIRSVNRGRLEAREVEIELQSDSIVFSKARDHAGQIPENSGDAPRRFPFAIPRNLETDAANISVRLTQKDFPGFSDNVRIPIRKVQPDFQIIHQILDSNGNGVIEQGESVELVVKMKNTGELDAEDMTLTMSIDTPGVLFNRGPNKVTIGRLPAGGESSPQRFLIDVQRKTPVGALPIHFIVNQKDFKPKPLHLALNVVEEPAKLVEVPGQEKPKPFFPAKAPGSPPVIAIASPKDNARVAAERIMLTGTAADHKGIANIEIAVNGVRVEDLARDIAVRPSSGLKQRDFNLQIPLKPGPNEILVTVSNIDNLSSSVMKKVYRESERGEIWAAVIGINQYRNIQHLKYAVNDARAYADYLRVHMGLDADHIFTLYDDQATKMQIQTLLGTTLMKKAIRPEDTVFIFFAGHGAPEIDASADDPDKVRKYLLTHEADENNLFGTAIPMDEITTWFQRIKAERIIFIADTCYSGAGGGRTILAQGKRAVLSDTFLDRISKGKGRIILTAGAANELSQESDRLQHGYFTYYLLEGLKGKADLDADNLIDIDEIYRYLNKEVTAATNGAQHPVKKGETEGQVVVGRVK